MLPFPSRPPLALAALLALGGACGIARAGGEPAVRLAAGPAPGELVFTLVNAGDEPLRVHREGTPLERPLSADVFEIVGEPDGTGHRARLPYAGRLVKRAAGADDVVAIAPGDALSVAIDLAAHYRVPSSGNYRVRFVGEIATVPSGGAARPDDGRRTPASAVTLALEPDLEALVRARPPTYVGCDATQQAAIVEATLAAERITGEALESLRTLPEPQRPSSPRYLRWFGEHDPTRYATVTDGYARMLDSLAGATLNFDCTCREEGVFAFVRPILLHDVNLCPLFFEVPLLGTDSQAGTLVHELSHFTALVGTDDSVYGQGPAAALAERDPALAVDNADNYEYFAENTPALPMVATGAPVGPIEAPAVPAPVDDDPSSFVRLVPGEERGGRLAARDADRYVVDGADVVSIRSTSGDADLYVYGDPALGEDSLVCRAVGDGSVSAVDACELPDGSRTWYAVVVGFDDAEYRIAARAVEQPVAVAPDGAIALGDAPVEGRLERGESVAYVARAPLRAELVSTSGDADLLLFTGTRPTADAELCRSVLTGGTDVCEATAEGEVLIVVVGYADSTYRLETRSPSDAAPVAPPDDDPSGVPVRPSPDPAPGPTPGPTPGPVALPDAGPSPDPGPFAASSGGSGGGGTGWPSLLAGALVLGLVRRRDGRRSPVPRTAAER